MAAKAEGDNLPDVAHELLAVMAKHSDRGGMVGELRKALCSCLVMLYPEYEQQGQGMSERVLRHDSDAMSTMVKRLLRGDPTQLMS